MRVALDSNVIIYAEGADSPPKRDLARALIAAIPAADLVMPMQAIGESTRWLFGKGGLSKTAAADRAARWLVTCIVQDTNVPVFEGALTLISKHSLQLWDAVILSAAAEAGASILLSEDIQSGFQWRGVKIVNPFAEPVPAEVDAILKMTRTP